MKKAIFFLLLMLLSSFVCAADEIIQSADRLNYWNSETHTVSVTNNGTSSVAVNITMPGGFTYDSGSCTHSSGVITCTLNQGQTKNYVVNSSSSSAEYQLSVFSPVANNTYTSNNVSFLRIKDEEIFHTLVEYGRGRGNYFFDSMQHGLAGSGHTGVGCAYLPNSTLFELNFLHKVLNVKQYFGDLTAEAYNAAFSCIYPNRTVVRQHLITGTQRNSSGTYVSYKISKIEGSWERMGYLGMDFKENLQHVGENLTVNCTNLTYSFPAGGGNIVVDEDSFTLQVRDRNPFTASASTSATIGNGTQEVLITYNITNNELYTSDDVVIEIDAPPYAAFIGTRGELWGAAQDQYRIEKTELQPGESEIIALVARFDTANAPAISGINLTKGVKIQFTACWEANAYNPSEYIQYLYGIGSGAVNMGIPSAIVNIRTRLQQLYNLSVTINKTITSINSTVNIIETIVKVINATTNETNYIVKIINSTANSILNRTNVILNNTLIILNDTGFIIDQLNCNGSNDSPICDKLSTINTSLQLLWNYTLQLNYTANNINVTVGSINVSGVNVTVNVDFTNLTNQLKEVKRYINCTNVTSNSSACVRLERIENYTLIINSSLTNLFNITTYFNTTVFGNLTFQDIINKISNASVDTSDVIDALRELREFQEEIVFLITDSFGLQQQALADFSKGDFASAADSLIEANSKLMQSLGMLTAEEESLQNAEAAGSNYEWVLILMLAIAVIFLSVYLFGKPKTPAGEIK